MGKYHTFHIGSPKKFHNNLNRYISYPMQGTSIGLACKNITFRILWKFSLKCFWYLKKWFVSGAGCNLQNAILCWHKICIILTHNHHSCGQILFLQFHPFKIFWYLFLLFTYIEVRKPQVLRGVWKYSLINTVKKASAVLSFEVKWCQDEEKVVTCWQRLRGKPTFDDIRESMNYGWHRAGSS